VKAEFTGYLTDILSSFVDRDMFMRFRGGGVGHKSIRRATNRFLQDRWPEELERVVERDEDDPMDPDQPAPVDPINVFDDGELSDDQEDEDEEIQENNLRNDKELHQENDKTLDFAYFALKSLETLENPFQGISRGPRGSRDEFISERLLKPLGNFKKHSSKT
jgi:hypothetical protein